MAPFSQMLEPPQNPGRFTDRAVNALVETISDTLKKGDSPALPGFETFEVRERRHELAAIRGRVSN